MLAVLKQVRAFQNPGKPHVDSLEDGPAYLALMAEEMLLGGVSESEAPAPSEPAPPADSPKLAVGQVWKDRLGREVTILSSDDHHTYPFEGSNNSSYMRNGASYRNDTPLDVDLVELIQDEDGWRPWKATKDSVCPVECARFVKVRWSDGSEETWQNFKGIYWNTSCPEGVSIIAYKVVQ